MNFATLLSRLSFVAYAASPLPPFGLLEVSHQVEALLGFTPRELLARPEFRLEQMHPDDRRLFENQLERLERREDHLRLEYRLMARDGRERWIADEAVLVRSKEGRPLVIQGLWTDVTEARFSEQALTRRLRRKP